MPAKKKGPLAGLPRSVTAQFTPEKRIEALTSALLIEQKANVDMLAKLQQNHKLVAELNEKLSIAQIQADRYMRNNEDQVNARRKERAEARAEINYWMAEVNRLHQELIDIRREAARAEVS